MLKNITYDPSQGEISAEVIMGGIVAVGYSLHLFSSDPTQPKRIQKEIGTNQQTHDDKFVLDPGKPVTDNKNRLVQLRATIYTSETDTPFSITLKFTQDIGGGHETVLGEVIKEGSISQSDDGKHIAMGAKLIQ